MRELAMFPTCGWCKKALGTFHPFPSLADTVVADMYCDTACQKAKQEAK